MKRFEGYIEFFNFLQENLHLASYIGVVEFYNACSGISKGCSCGKKKRIAMALDKYLNLEELMDDSFKENLKITLQVASVHFLHEDNVFLES